DQGQDIVGADLAGKNGSSLRRSVEGGAAVFSVCGGYQLLGHEYVPEIGPSIPGLGILDVTTRAGRKTRGSRIDCSDGRSKGGTKARGSIRSTTVTSSPRARKPVRWPAAGHR
ncbi:MAG: hypothetical protein E6I14_08725, partial [Chloroflexi bacterium]